jgi:hypothetical protein
MKVWSIFRSRTAMAMQWKFLELEGRIWFDYGVELGMEMSE